MNSIKFFFVATLLFVLPFLSIAQQVKPKFQKLVNVIYNIDTSGTNKNIIIKDYLEINDIGKVHSISVYYDGIADSTYQLPDTTIIALNKVFNGSKKLTKYMVTDKVSEDQYISGLFEFVSYTDISNKTDNFIVIQGFMSEFFNKIYNKLYRLPFVHTTRTGKTIDNESLQAEILKYHNACKYMPKIVEPPRVMPSGQNNR